MSIEALPQSRSRTVTITATPELIDAPPRAPMEYRSVEQLDVQYPQRTISLLAAPYEHEIAVLRRNEIILETIARGAFDGVERRANRIKVLRDHDDLRAVGRAVALHPSREAGLVAELRIARTQLGDETLALADDGVLDASVGFAPMYDGEQWSDNRTRRRITKAFLGHIALVSNPAYETANVLDVRSDANVDEALRAAASETPRKDEVLARLRELGYPLASK